MHRAEYGWLDAEKYDAVMCQAERPFDLLGDGLFAVSHVVRDLAI
jgi:hypothetical protein